MKRIVLHWLMLSALVTAYGQSKKILDHIAYDLWRKIENPSISADGNFVQYTLESHGYAEPKLLLHGTNGVKLLEVEKAKGGKFSYDGKYLFFTIYPASDSLKDLRRIKTKEEKLPKNQLAIYDLTKKSLTKIGQLQSFQSPEKGSDWIAYQTHFVPDSTQKKAKKSNKENGYPLTIHRLSDGSKWELPYVIEYSFSENGNLLSAISTGDDTTFLKGVYIFNTESSTLRPVYSAKGKFKNLALSKDGKRVAFHADLDTTKTIVRNIGLYQWEIGSNNAQLIIDSNYESLRDNWLINENQKPFYSKDGAKLYFGTGTSPFLKDTALLEEEIVNVEVWTYTDSKLHTQQKVDAKKDNYQSYLAVFDVSKTSINFLGNEIIPEIETGNEGNANIYLGKTSDPYLISGSWEGYPDYQDIYRIHADGNSKMVAKRVRGDARFSPDAQFFYWYDYADTAWYTHHLLSETTYKVTSNQSVSFSDERNDSPDYPSPYGILGWTQNDEKILIYDRYDIWEIDPKNETLPVNMTATGRKNQISFRYIRLDPEERFITVGQNLMLRAFNDKDKSEALVQMNYGKKGMKTLVSGKYHYNAPLKSRLNQHLIFSFENFEIFPDLYFAKNSDFSKPIRISQANPQQSQYNWGTAELYRFTSLDGIALEGLLIKPENFDPKQKYPMIVNFYERSADDLYNHREPSPGRSTINYSFYASRGYVIFNPDIVYREGYPGESAYNSAMPGVLSLINEGYIDKERIGIQGHSWGGYQIAYMVTKSDLFKCAEAGAPVPNMISAYGGIRWQSGLVRQFQYEHTQSRIGGTLWEYPLRYIENSPIFNMDKINTPLLLMANDADGHVPWYQGIEMFVALRRLGKPSWMLNYQGEPHWPVKLQNRIDFNIRLQQYFDYYLKDAPKPVWMEAGVPAIKVGIEQNLQLIGKP